jgi:hypothetical protein
MGEIFYVLHVCKAFVYYVCYQMAGISLATCVLSVNRLFYILLLIFYLLIQEATMATDFAPLPNRISTVLELSLRSCMCQVVMSVRMTPVVL